MDLHIVEHESPSKVLKSILLSLETSLAGEEAWLSMNDKRVDKVYHRKRRNYFKKKVKEYTKAINKLKINS